MSPEATDTKSALPFFCKIQRMKKDYNDKMYFKTIQPSHFSTTLLPANSLPHAAATWPLSSLLHHVVTQQFVSFFGHHGLQPKVETWLVAT